MTEAPSPFIEGTNIQMAWDSTSLGWLKSCPKLYEYSMIQGWRAKSLSVDLDFGLHYHRALETFDRLRAEGQDYDQALRGIVRQTLVETWPWLHEDTNKSRANLLRSIIWYCEHFRDDNAHTVILTNGKPAVELSFRIELDHLAPNGSPYLLSGHLDRIVEFGGEQYVSDRKTSRATLGPYYFKHFDMDPQMSGYTLAGQVAFKSPVRGVIIDAAQIAVGFTRFERGVTYRTPARTEEWLADTYQWLDLAVQYANRNHWPRNDRSCRMCAFKGVCASDPSVRTKFLESDFEHRPWNPIKVRDGSPS